MIDELLIDLYHVITRRYDDDVGNEVNYMGYSLEAIMCHLVITPSIGEP